MITAFEQYLIELLNRARADPAGEAARHGVDLNDGLAPGTLDAAPRQPLAPSMALLAAADGHSAAMLAGGFFAHVAPDGSIPASRATAAGWTPAPDYPWLSGFVGENLAGLFSFDPDIASVETVESHHAGLFRSVSHRVNLLTADYSEVGVGEQFGAFSFDGQAYPHASLATQKFAHGGRVHVTGVVIDDRDGDRFYDVGEGLGGVDVAVVGAGFEGATQTTAGGGYAVEVPAGGVYQLVFSGGGLVGPIARTVVVDGANVKIDALAADAQAASALGYVASYDDLLAAFAGAADVAAAGALHWARFGLAEGRGLEGRPYFEAAGYRANYADLAAFLDADAATGAAHFIRHGFAEGRLRYDGALYLASHDDLIDAFGPDRAAAVAHWQAHGRAEGRAIDFDATQYLDNYADLAATFGPDGLAAAAFHYVAFGRAEGRTDVDPLDYVASHADLVLAVGAADADPAAFGLAHHHDHGRAEGRRADFDAWSYLSRYPDLSAALGRDTDAAARHFIAWGFGEGRTDDPI